MICLQLSGGVMGHRYTEASFAFSEEAWPFLASDLDVEALWLVSRGFQMDPYLGLF